MYRLALTLVSFAVVSFATTDGETFVQAQINPTEMTFYSEHPKGSHASLKIQNGKKVLWIISGVSEINDLSDELRERWDNVVEMARIASSRPDLKLRYSYVNNDSSSSDSGELEAKLGSNTIGVEDLQSVGISKPLPKVNANVSVRQNSVTSHAQASILRKSVSFSRTVSPNKD